MTRIRNFALIVSLSVVGISTRVPGQVAAADAADHQVPAQASSEAPVNLQDILSKAQAAEVEKIGADMGCTSAELAALRPPLLAILGLQYRISSHYSTLKRGNFVTAGDLKAVIDDPDGTPEKIVAKLAAFRAARAHDQEALAAVQKNLRPLLSVREEAILVLRGLMQ